MTYYSILKTGLGGVLLTANPTELTGLYFGDRAHAPAIPGDWIRDPEHIVLKQAREQIEEYLDGARASFAVPLRLSGTTFQQRIWAEIAKIPYGQTITYGDLAKRVGSPNAVRAAGMATGRNPIGIIIPCHRVIGKDGSLTGYAGGLERKRHLLGLERQKDESKKTDRSSPANFCLTA